MDWLTEYDGLWSVVFCESRIIMICEKNLMSLYFVAKDCFKKSFRKPHPKSTDVNYAGQLVTNAWLFSVAITLAQIAQYWRYSLSPSRFCTVCCVFLPDVCLYLHVRCHGNHLSSTRFIQERITEQVGFKYYNAICSPALLCKKHTQSTTDRQAEERCTATDIFML